MRIAICAAALVLSVAPAFAQHDTTPPAVGSQGAAGNGGNGVTTSSSSGPVAKTGAERSPTGGAPTRNTTGETGAAAGANAR